VNANATGRDRPAPTSLAEPPSSQPGGRFVRVVDRLSSWAGGLAGIAVVLILALVCVEVLLRSLFGRSTMIADEMGGYLNVAVIYFGLAYTFREGGFIRVELLYDRLRGATRRTAQWLILLASIGYVAALTFYMARQALYSFENDIRSVDFSQTPLFLPQLLVVVGCLLMLLQLLAYVARRMRGLP
jgi:TRAP-type C4-dicarboxylate transport system permease small subunit